MEWFLVAIWFMLAGAAVGAFFSQNRERDPILGATLGFLLGPIGWLIELLAKDQRPICMECGGRTALNAWRCRNCGVELTEPVPPPHTPRPKSIPPPVPVHQYSAEIDDADGN